MTSSRTARAVGRSSSEADPMVRSRPHRPPPRARRRAPPRRRPRHRGPSASRPRGRTSRARARTRHSTGDRGGPSSGRRSRRTARAPGSSANRARARPSRRPERGQPEAHECQRMTRDVDDRPEDLRGELAGITDERAERPPPGPPIRLAQPGRGRRQRSFQDRRPAAVERMRDRGVGMDQLRRHARRGRSWRRTARRGSSGRIVEHTSWRKPGSVSSVVRVPPPAVGAAS